MVISNTSNVPPTTILQRHRQSDLLCIYQYRRTGRERDKTFDMGARAIQWGSSSCDTGDVLRAMRTGSSGRDGGQGLTLGVLLSGGFLHLCAFVCMSVYHELRLRQLEVSRFANACVVIKVNVNSLHTWIKGCPLFSTSYICLFSCTFLNTSTFKRQWRKVISDLGLKVTGYKFTNCVIKFPKGVFVLKYLSKRTIIFALQPENLTQRRPVLRLLVTKSMQTEVFLILFNKLFAILVIVLYE